MPIATVLEDVSILARKLRTAFDAAARERGLSLARARLLSKLRSNDGMTQRALAEELEVEAATMVGLLDGLEHAGAIVRVAVEGDRRAKRVELTDQGMIQSDAVKALISSFRRDLLANIDVEELAIAQRVILQMQANLDQRT